MRAASLWLAKRKRRRHPDTVPVLTAISNAPTVPRSSRTRADAAVSQRGFVRLAEERKPAHLPNGLLPEFRKFYYELAQGNTPGQIAALLKMVPVSQVLYGTDFPFRDGAEVNAGIAAYGFNPDDIRSIEREVAFKLIPRLKQS
jgi:predicted TIM-barrel fold metal-dependent hydrolase